MSEIIALIIVSSVAWLWWSSTRAREIAVAAAATACRRRDVQLLDQTVKLHQMKLQRDNTGTMRIARLFTFEFSVEGLERESGYVVTLGDQLVQVHLDLVVDSGPTMH